MTPDFEWMTATVMADDGETRVPMHYLVDPCGQVRADIEEPTKGRPSYISDLYWGGDGEIPRYGHWLTLSLAKAHVETAYIDKIRSRGVIKKSASRKVKK